MAAEQELQSRITFLINEVGLVIPQDRINGWLAELAGGAGRDLNTLWSDILKHVGGAQRAKLEAWVQSKFGEPIASDRMTGLVDELINGTRSFSDMAKDIATATGQGSGVKTKKGTPAGEEQTEEGVGTPGEEGLTILTAKKMNWYYDSSTGKWYVGYGMPNSSREIVFEADPKDMDALFGQGIRPTDYTKTTAKALFARQDITFGGGILQMEGTGSFEAEYDAVLARALDAGKLPDWASGSPEIMDILYIAQAEERGDAWTLDQISKTTEFKNRFPGLDKLKKQGNLSWEEAVSGFLQFEAGVRALEKKFDGRERIKPEHIGALLEAGYSMTEVQDTYEKFDTMKKHKPALDAFNEVLRAQGKKPLTPAQQITFLQGTAPEEIYDIYEASSIRESAVAAGLDKYFDTKEAISAALATPGVRTGQEIDQMMQNAAKLALQFRHQIDTSKYGLDPDDIIQMSLGLAPASGVSSAEVRRKLQQIAQEAEGFLQQGAKPFTGFTSQGVPQAASLGALRQEN